VGRAGAPFKTVQIPVDDIDPAKAAHLASDFAAVGADALMFAFLRERDPEAVRRLAEALFA
jgi:hypothetical protein